MIKIFQDLTELNDFAAEKFIEIGNRAIEDCGAFTIALAGGSTPKSLYELLASEKYRSQIEWSKVFFFFGDERNVPPENEDSNYRMAFENLLAPLKISKKNVFRWQTELGDAEQIAEDYAGKIRDFFKSGENDFPRFDLILLGMGGDGHTVSLFPDTEALNEKEKIAVSNRVEKLNTNRLTLTFPTINNAANVIFLVSGAAKAEILQKVVEGENQPRKYPSQSVKPIHGNIFWLVDREAARLLG